MLNINKNYGFSKANCAWILSLDADERVTEELGNEIQSLQEDSFSGYYIPRKNIIFGKWIENTGWYPDYQLRLFKRGKGRFEEKHVHEMLKIDGNTSTLKNPLLHFNYDNIDQFLTKMVRTSTVSEAENLIEKGYTYNPLDIVKMPLSEFVKRYFAEKGYKDGMHGLVLSLLMAFYHFVVFLRIWEKNKYPDQTDTQEIIGSAGKLLNHEFGYWISHIKIAGEKNIFKKNLLKVKRKVLH